MNVKEVVQPKTFGHYLLTLMSYEFHSSVEYKRKGFKKWKNIFVHIFVKMIVILYINITFFISFFVAVAL